MSESLYSYERGEQLLLPLDVRPERLVHWLNARFLEKRTWYLGKKVGSELVMEPDRSWPQSTRIKADDIDKVSDPQLRYALRFQDAANAVGWTQEGVGCYTGHNVYVEATDDGFDSTLISATYTGITRHGSDSFMENLYQAQPEESE